MKLAALVAVSGLAGAELFEIVARLGRGGSVQAHFNAACRFAINGNVKVDRVGDLRVLFAKQPLKEAANHVQLARRRRCPSARCCQCCWWANDGSHCWHKSRCGADCQQ